MIKGLVSIIMPVYNGEPYLKEAIQSVLFQDYKEWELLIIDNGSTDSSRGTVLNFPDPRITLLHEENRGVSNARNKGLASMRGEFFCFLDCDDRFTPVGISSRLLLFSGEPGLAFVDGCVSIRNADLSEEIRAWTPRFNGQPLQHLLIHDPSVFFGPTWMFRREEGVTYRFNPALTHGEDLYFYIEFSQGKHYGFTRETILHYRVRPGQASSSLEGMEAGYRISGEELKKLPHVSEDWRRKYIRKAWSITWKSYLKTGRLRDALRVIFNPGFRP